MVINHLEVRHSKRNICKYFLRIVRSGVNMFQLNLITKYVQPVEIAKRENFQSEIICFLSGALPFAVLDSLNYNCI